MCIPILPDPQHAAGNYYKKYSRTNQQKNAFSRIGAKVWNNVPLYVRNLGRKMFSKKIYDLLLRILINEKDNPEIPMIIQRLSE